MDAETIGAMDGPALAQLAWEVGLRPEGVAWPAGCAFAYDAGRPCLASLVPARPGRCGVPAVAVAGVGARA